MNNVPIPLTLTVTERDWNKNLGGWNCRALEIPGAILEDVFIDGDKADDKLYSIDPKLKIVRWSQTEPPKQAAFVIAISSEDLSSKELTLKWKKMAIILPVFATILAATITAAAWHLNKKAISKADGYLVNIANLKQQIKESENNCRLENTELKNKCKEILTKNEKDIVYNYTIPNEPREIKLVIIGDSNSSSLEDTAHFLRSPEFQVSSHYLIGTNGKIVSIVPEEHIAWHIGANSQWKNMKGLNQYSIGIELIHISTENKKGYPKAQIESLNFLLANIIYRYQLGTEEIITQQQALSGKKITDITVKINKIRKAVKARLVHFDA